MQEAMHAVYACLALALVATPPAAVVEGERLGTGVLAVAPPPGPGAGLVEVTLELRDRLAEYDATVLDGPVLRERMVGPPSGAALAELDGAYEGARSAWIGGDHEGSVRTLRDLVTALERRPDDEETFARWTRAMLRLARFELNLGREEAARRTIERLVRAAPDLEPDPAEHPPRLLGELSRARAALAAAPQGALLVSTSAPGARVFVDGREVGEAPLELAVARGRHRVSGLHGELRVGPLAVEVGDGRQELRLDFAIVEALRPAAGPGLALAGGDGARQLARVGAHLGLDRVVAVALVDEEGARHVVGSVHDVRSGKLVREARVRLASGAVPPGGSRALAEFLVTGQARSALVELPGGEPPVVSLAVAPPAPSPEGPPETFPSAAPVSARVLRWTAVGTGVVALGLATLGALERRAAADRYDEARARRAWPGGLATDAQITDYNRLVRDGDAARRNAVLSWTGAGASAVATGILGYVHYKRTGELGPFRF